MTENKDSGKFPKIKPPSKTDVKRAVLEHAAENPDIQKLMGEGKGVFIDTTTGEVKIIEEGKKPKNRK
jgi:hypothetical protein